MDRDLKVDDTLVIPAAELNERFTPSGGPGGQHANRSSTRVELRFDVAASRVLSDAQRSRLRGRLGDEVRVVADERRSQSANRAIARDRLAARLRSALGAQRRRRPTRPTRGAQKRRLEAKRRRSELKAQRRRPGY
ncbi:MAG: alternative ribosome rescue aminoacyl-tRNA hydrolase ArfB [Microthrixaceae bacterium]